MHTPSHEPQASGTGTEDGVRLIFRSGVSVTEGPAGTVRVEHPASTLVLRRVPDELRRTLLGMPVGCASADAALRPDAAPPPLPAAVIRGLERLIEYRVADASGEDVLAVQTMVRTARHQPRPPRPGTALRLSRFAFIRRGPEGLVLESPRSPRRVRLLNSRAGALVGALGTTATPRQLAAALGVSVAEAVRLTGHLVGAALLDQATDGEFAEESAAEQQWSFHDMLFHSRSRIGHHDYPVGGVFPFAGSIPPAPAVRPSPDGPALTLPRPDLTAVRTADPLLTDALEARRSIRVPGEEPISLDQLGEFLYRVARIRAVTSEETDGHIPYPITTRPYPSGGASYDVEFWLTIGRCRGAEPGIYYYDPYAHRLVLVNADAGDRDLVLGRAGRAINDGGPPDVAVTLTSRVQRVSWKYAGMAYATTMKHVGVVYQTMYLVATAMRLAGCAVGNGDSREAERILGLDPLCEPAVGEFVLSAAPQPTAPAHPEARHDAWVPVHGYDWHLSSRTELEHLASSREGRTG